MALGRIGPAASEAVPDLLIGLRRSFGTPASSGETAVALGRIGDGRPEVIEALREGLNSQTVNIQKGCVEALYRLRWVPEGPDRARIETLAAGTHKTLRIWARMLLASADGKLDEQADGLVSLLKGQEWYVTQTAAYALDSLGARAARALPALRELCPPTVTRRRIDSDADLKRQAAEPAIRHIEAAIAAQAGKP